MPDSSPSRDDVHPAAPSTHGGSSVDTRESPAETAGTTTAETPNVTRRRVLATLGGGGVASLAGCPSALTGSSTPLEARWVSDTRTEYGQNHHEIGVVSTGDGTVIGIPLNDMPGTDGCGMVALDGRGEVRWRDDREMECDPHGIGDMYTGDVDGDGDPELLVGTKDAGVLAFDARSGDVAFQQPLIETVPYSAPVVFEDPVGGERLLATVDNSGTIHVTEGDGSTRWSEALGATVYPAPLVADLDGDGHQEMLVVTGRNPGRVTAFDHEGSVVWETELGDGGREWRLIDREDGRGVVVSTWGGEVLLLDPPTGDIRWSVSAAYRGVVGAFDGQYVYSSARNGTVNALDPADGSVAWTQDALDSEGPAVEPTVGNVTGSDAADVVFASHDGTVGLLDPENGTIRHEETLDGDLYTPPKAVDLQGNGRDDVVALYGDGRVAALSYEE